MTLFPDEKIVSQSNDNSIILTTHRIYQERNLSENSSTKSIMLEHITSCETYYNKNKVWIAVIVIGIIMAIVASDIEKVVGVIAILAGIFLYLKTTKSYIKVASPTAELLINVLGMDKNKISEFIDLIEQTKHKRLLIVGNKNN